MEDSTASCFHGGVPRLAAECLSSKLREESKDAGCETQGNYLEAIKGFRPLGDFSVETREDERGQYLNQKP